LYILGVSIVNPERFKVVIKGVPMLPKKGKIASQDRIFSKKNAVTSH
jgi:hypothetical protein